MGRRDPCVCCGKTLEPEIEAGNVCRECFPHLPWRPHPGGSLAIVREREKERVSV